MVRDLLERLVWTFVASFLTTLLAALAAGAGGAIDLSAIQSGLVAAALAGLIAVGNSLLVIARWRLSILPNPGEGLTRRKPQDYPEDDPLRWARDDGQPHGDPLLPPPAV